MSDHERISVELTPEIATFVREVVEAGEYASSTEVVQAALTELRERRDSFGYTLDELRQLAREGLRSGPSRFATIEDLKAEARRRRDVASRSG